MTDLNAAAAALLPRAELYQDALGHWCALSTNDGAGALAAGKAIRDALVAHKIIGKWSTVQIDCIGTEDDGRAIYMEALPDDEPDEA